MAIAGARRFSASQWNIGVDDSVPPPDPTAKLLTCTIAGNTPRYITQDGSFAIWTATMEVPGEEAPRQVTLKGPLGRVTPGEMLSCQGYWKEHDQHGWQFEVKEYRSALPTTATGVAEWLAHRVDGIGPTFAKAIVSHFGADNVFDVLDEDPSRLREVRTAKGRALPERQVEKAIVAWDDVKAIRQIETFLFGHKITANMASRLYAKYGDEVIRILTTEPYTITEMRGVGFLIADRIARNMGTPLNDPARVKAGLLYVLDEIESDGHTFLSLQQLIGHAGEYLDIRDPQIVVEQASALSAARKIVVEPDELLQQRVYSAKVHRLETRLARNVRRLLDAPRNTLFAKPERPTAPDGTSPEELLRLKLPSDEQWSVVDMIRSNRLVLLTGGPGTGKTTSQAAVINALAQQRKTVALAAPTGKAARRMSEQTGLDARTIHRLLEFSPFDGGFQRHEHNPLTDEHMQPLDLLIVDEVSMLSLDLADSLFRAVGDHTHVLLVGDPDQLPPVGAGKVLADLINSERVPRVHLTRIFRQAAKSMIIQNARRINRGDMPYMRQEAAEAALGQRMLNDFYWVARRPYEAPAGEEPDRDRNIRDLVLDMASNRIPRVFGFDPKTEVMVLSPQRQGGVGLIRLNAELEALLNAGPDGRPKKPVAPHGICVGSRIIQTKNQYDPSGSGKESMNGEIGIVLDYNEVEKACLLSFDDGDREFWLPTQDMETFQLAWAISIHKSQGSEFKAIVVPISMGHYNMLTRALTYTAITRASKLCVMAGEKRALQMAVGKQDMRKRNSTLAPRITDAQLSGELF
jgi:exodeoxyribonuclease V alpha subunit